MAHLTLNEGAGDQAADSSGHGHHARLVNTQWVEFGLEGGAVRLTGDDSYIDMGQHRDLDFTQDFTLSLWMKAERFEHGSSLFNYGNHTRGWQTYVFRSFIAMSSRTLKGPSMVWYRRFATGTSVSYPFTHIVITGRRHDDEHTTISFYVDGQPGKTFTLEGRLPGSGNRLTVGDFASAEGRDFHGIIDEIKVYSRPLSAREVRRDFEHTKTARPAAVAAVVATPLPEVELPPLKKRRVAVFDPDAGFPGSVVRGIDWFEQQLDGLGLESTRLGNSDLVNTDILAAKRFDTLILPTKHMPFEAEYSIYQFLDGGGNLITVSCTPTTWNAGTDGELEQKQHRRGWFAPFLIRHLDFPWAQRKVTQAVGLNPVAGKLVGTLLPTTAGAHPQGRYSLVDRWDLHPAAPGRPGDTDVSGGRNVHAAADVMLPLYQLPNGEATDFHVYRYFNNHLFGATLVELGAVGSGLLESGKGPDVLRAVLHLAETRLPGEASPEHYARISQLHRDWSRLGDTYVDTLTELRDAAYLSYLTGSDAWQELNRQAVGVEERMTVLIKQKDTWDQGILNGSGHAEIDRLGRELAEKIASADRDFLALQAPAKSARRNAGTPAPVPVRSPYGQLLVEGFLTLPTNLTMYRTWHFPTMKKIGVNLYSKRMHPWYSKDPETRRRMSGIVRDLNFQYGVTVMLKPHSGELNPADGTVTDAEPQEYDYAKAEEYIKKNLANLYGYPALRIGLAHETGLGLKYWGSQAEQDFRGYLKEQYADIAALNRHWSTRHPDFASIELPTRQPTTAAEHAAWEHWRDLRETKFEHYLKFFYDTVKKHAPDLAVSSTVSTGSLESPLFGVNFYNVTRYQDISGIDGTAVNPPKEWLYLDLTKKRVLTYEWGGLYQRKSLRYVNGKLWEELTGGSLGFNLWLWQFGSHDCNYVNFAGLPTLYGSQARVTVRDARKIEHVIMDGVRADPEIGILFSQTTRVHDQGWGGRGEPTFSPHVQAVINYYAHFLRFHRSARVIAEEKLLEEDVSYLKMLIVPHATFLCEEVQRKLVAYARNGGSLLLEGRAGQLDNFGRPLDLLFRQAETVPAYAADRTLTLGKAVCPMADGDAIFAPTALDGQGRVLARFGEDPAVLARPLGKGQVIVAGLAAGLRQYPAFAPLLDAVWRDQKLSPRFIVSDDAVLLREWQHASDTYLLLTSRTENPGATPLEVKVRGNCRIEDYLFGMDVRTRFGGSYTTFTTLMGNGGRVFRIPDGRPARASLARITDAQAKEPSADRDGETTVSLPFRGRSHAGTALRWGAYWFRNSTIASGIDPDQGETYLIISKGAEVQKRRIVTGEECFFRMREKTFKVRCVSNFYKFPFHSEVLIEAVAGPPSESACRVETQGEAVTVRTGLLELGLELDHGGWIRRIALADDRINQVATRGALSACTENVGQVPGPFIEHSFAARTVKQSDDEVVLELVNPQLIDQKTLRKTLTVRRGVAGFDYSLRCFNEDDRTESPPFELRWHPELAIGGLADGPDMFVVPGPRGVRNLPFRASQSGMRLEPGADWAAVVDRSEKLAFVTTFRPEQVQTVYIWQDATFYDLEIFSPRRQVKRGESIDLDLGIYLLRGLNGLDEFRNGFGAHAALPENFDQRRPVQFAAQVASAYETIQPVRLVAELKQGERTIADFGGEIADTVAFDRPISRFLEADLAGCPDGVYHLDLLVKIAGHPPMTVRKELRLAGTERAGHLRYYDRCKETLAILAKSPPPGSGAAIFSVRAALETFRSHIAAGRLAEAVDERGKLAEAIEKLRGP